MLATTVFAFVSLALSASAAVTTNEPHAKRLLGDFLGGNSRPGGGCGQQLGGINLAVLNSYDCPIINQPSNDAPFGPLLGPNSGFGNSGGSPFGNNGGIFGAQNDCGTQKASLLNAAVLNQYNCPIYNGGGLGPLGPESSSLLGGLGLKESKKNGKSDKSAK